MKVLVACEFSAVVSSAFRSRGHDAWSCDLLDTEGDPRYHIKDDVLNHLDEGWALMIAHPSCQYLANSGARHLYLPGTRERNIDRWEKLKDAAKFFLKLWNAPIDKICIENPIMHKWARESIGIKYSQIIQPYHFGCPESKATCLWLKNLPPLKPTKIIPKDQVKQSVHRCAPGPNRWKIRSKTFDEVGKAMADAWGNYENNTT